MAINDVYSRDALRHVLLRVKNGETSFAPKSQEPADVKAFHSIAAALEHATTLGYIEAKFQRSRMIGTHGYILQAIVTRPLSYQAEQYLLSVGSEDMERSTEHRPDFTCLGDIRYRKQDYEIVHSALAMLLGTIRRWNELAISNGVSKPPYEDEQNYLTNMVEWGKEKLREPNTLSITVRGISVESRRFERAALEYAALESRREALEKSIGMPRAVAHAMLARPRAYAEQAKNIEVRAHPILDELRHEHKAKEDGAASLRHEWDVFISHASEDKVSIVRPLALALQEAGLRVWFDEAELTIGDGLRRSIDRGLARSRFGIAILSDAFFSKDWPQRELDGLSAREVNGVKVILPVWHGVDRDTVVQYSPMLADRMAVRTSRGIPVVVQEVLKALAASGHTN